MTDVGVVIPVHNGERFLRDAIENAMSDDVRPEVVVVDDGSTDGTADIARGYSDAIYVRIPNGGPSAARNAGAAVSRSEFLCFLDHDDLMHPDKLTRQRDHLMENPGAACVLTHWRHVSVGDAPPLPGGSAVATGVAPISAMYRAAAFRSIGGFDEGYHLGEDVEILSRARSKSLVVDVIDEVLLDHRVHGANLSYESAWDPASLVSVLKERIEAARGREPPPKPRTEPGLVSIVVAVYNGEKYLDEALASCFAQVERPFEVIVVDDGSTDRSGEIALAHDLRAFVHQPNRGPAVARQLGLNLCRGEYVCFFDHDDVMFPDKLKKQAAYLDARPDVAAVLGRQEPFLEDGHDLPRWMWRDPVYGDLGGVVPESAMVRRSALVDIGGWLPERQMILGLDVLARLRDAGGRVEVLPELVMKRRIHPNNRTNDISGLQADMLRSFKTRLDTRRKTSEGRG